MIEKIVPVLNTVEVATVVGPRGIAGKDGADGRHGRDGTNGKDGINGVDGRDGIDGQDGADGATGAPGTASPEFIALAAQTVTNAETAVLARDGAETARVGAESARDGAVTARVGAEAARDLALAGQFAGAILGNAHLNTITVPGIYRQGNSGDATLANGYPVGRAGVMEVLQRGTTSLMQTFYEFSGVSDMRIFYQRQLNGTIWSPWRAFPSQRIDTTAGYRVLTWDDVNNREQVIYGDTGWRNITALAGGAMTFTPPHGIWIRRVGDGVSIEIAGAYLSPSTIVSPPLGFRSSTRYLGRGTLARHAAPSLVAGVRMVSGVGALDISPAPGWTSGDVASGTISYSTTDAWPASLPGTPA